MLRAGYLGLWEELLEAEMPCSWDNFWKITRVEIDQSFPGRRRWNPGE